MVRGTAKFFWETNLNQREKNIGYSHNNIFAQKYNHQSTNWASSSQMVCGMAQKEMTELLPHKLPHKVML